MEDRRTNGIKKEHLDVSDKVSKSASSGDFDFRKLYGDLSRKLLSTPVEEIFSEVITDARTKKATPHAGNTSPSIIHPAFPMYGATPSSPLSPLGNHCEQSACLASPLTLYPSYPNPLFSIPNSDSLLQVNGKPDRASLDSTDGEFKVNTDIFDGMENIDIQKLVDDFRVTLEKYGVSQRFAARFIMQDTSQGNLSFLMEKGRNKKWAELSSRGRLPYIKMKAWLESKEHQMVTLDMLKYSQEVRKSGPREPFNRRERFSIFQLNVLCRMFEENPNPPMNIRTSVAERLGIPLDRVNVWFQNQRARGFPARKNLQLQTMYETEQDSSKVFELNAEYSQFRKSLASPVATPLLMTHTSNITTSPKLHSTESSPTVKTSHSPTQFSPTSTSFPNDLQSNDVPLDLSVPSAHDYKNRNKSGDGHHESRDSLTPRNTECHSDFGLNMVKLEKTQKVGAAKRKRGCVPQQIVQRKNDTVPEPKTRPPPKRVKTESTSSDGTEYNYLLHAEDLQSVHEPESDKYHQPKFTNDDEIATCSTYITQDRSAHDSPVSDSSSSAYLSQEDSIIVSRDNIAMLNRQSSNQSAVETMEKYGGQGMTPSCHGDVTQPDTVEVFKVLCASIATKKDNSTINDVKEPDLD